MQTMTSGSERPTGIPDVGMRRGERLGEDQLRALMVRYQRGDSEAIDELVRSLSPLLWRYFMSPHNSRSDTEDLLQDCWVRVHRSRHTYRPSDPLLPWIFAIARHTRLDGYRQRRRRESRETLVATPPEVAVSHEHPTFPDTTGFARLLKTLPATQRDVILMLKVSDMSLEEIARATSSTVGAIKQKAHRAYARLREIIEKEGK
jgi:RNA polymerase sigma-70 factor (ECF subfamily)